MDYSSTKHYQMDETEDEEVKRNCYGRKLKYESSSDESCSESDHETEDSDDPESDEPESPAKLVSSVLEAKCFGEDVFRPVARSLSFPASEDEEEEERNELSDDDSSESDDERSCNSEEASEPDASDDEQASEPESDLESTCEETDSEVESLVSSDNEQSDCDLLSIRNEVSMSDNESRLSEDQDPDDLNSIVEDNTFESRDIEPEDNDDLNMEIEFQSACDEEFVVNHLSRSDSSCSVDLLDIEVENLIGQNERTTCTEFEEESGVISPDLCVTASRKRKDIPDRCPEIVTPDLSEVATKKIRSAHTSTDSEEPLALPMFPPFSSLSSNARLPTVLSPRLKLKEESTIDEEEIDHQLAEELSCGIQSLDSLESDPVPFLTPPASPITALRDDGVTICEWPSNLVVDSAYSSAIELRALSPSSLVKLEVKDKIKHPPILPMPCTSRIRSVSEVSSTM